jgi:hypothetical protein
VFKGDHGMDIPFAGTRHCTVDLELVISTPSVTKK